MKFIKFYFLLFLLCWIVPEASAAPSVTMAPASDSIYVVQGNDFSGASGIDIAIRYDPAAVASPQVVQGGLVGGALMAINASTPGMIRLALVRITEINGSGAIATITFTRVTSTGADILSLASSVINSSGRNIPVTSQVVNSVKTADAGASADKQTGQAATGSPSSSVAADTGKTAAASTGVIGMVVPVPSPGATAETQGSIPSAEQAAPDVRMPDSNKVVSPEAAKEPSGETVLAKAIEPERKKIKMYPSILERFKEFKGEKTPEALMALFGSQENRAGQDPPIVLSDGKSTIKVVVELNSSGENNNLLLDGVSLVSLKNKEKNLWIAELLPDTRTYEATVSVPGKGQLNIMPLTVAPPMDVKINPSAGRLTETDFKLYLKEMGTAKAPRFDLNGDGRRDYIDDYIFTANYLVQHDSTPSRR